MSEEYTSILSKKDLKFFRDSLDVDIWKEITKVIIEILILAIMIGGLIGIAIFNNAETWKEIIK